MARPAVLEQYLVPAVAALVSAIAGLWGVVRFFLRHQFERIGLLEQKKADKERLEEIATGIFKRLEERDRRDHAAHATITTNITEMRGEVREALTKWSDDRQRLGERVARVEAQQDAANHRKD